LRVTFPDGSMAGRTSNTRWTWRQSTAKSRNSITTRVSTLGQSYNPQRVCWLVRIAAPAHAGPGSNLGEKLVARPGYKAAWVHKTKLWAPVDRQKLEPLI